MYVENRYNRKVNELKQSRHYNTKEFRKSIARVCEIIEKEHRKPTLSEYREIAKEIYKTDTLIKARSLKRMMSTEESIKRIDTQLIAYYSGIGYDLEKAKELTKEAEQFAREKKDAALLLKIAQMILAANNLTQSSTITARTTETTDFSKLGKGGLPAQKVVKTLEITKSEAITGDISDDQTDVNSKPSPENQ